MRMRHRQNDSPPRVASMPDMDSAPPQTARRVPNHKSNKRKSATAAIKFILAGNDPFSQTHEAADNIEERVELRFLDGLHVGE